MSVHIFQISVSEIVMIVIIVPTICNALHIFCFQRWHVLARTLAEVDAWKFAEENNIDMVTINPGKAIGPILQPSTHARKTAHSVLKLINGKFNLLA